jgi:hypothetical protein
VNHVALLNDDGTVDPTFVGDANGYVWTTQALKDEKALVAGAFTDYNGMKRNRITRILISQPYQVLKATEPLKDRELMKTAELNFSVYPNPASSSVTIDNLEKEGVLEISDVSGKLIYTEINYSGKRSLDVSSYSNGIYFISYRTGEQVRRNKLVLSR